MRIRRTMIVVGLVLVPAVATGCGGGARDSDLVGPKGPAELIIGTWALEELHVGRVGRVPSGGRMPWYHSSRLEYRPDGTCIESDNQNLFRIRVQRGISQFRVEGNTIHKAAKPQPDSPRLNEPGFLQPDGFHHWETTIADLTDTRLIQEFTHMQERYIHTYRRVR